MDDFAASGSKTYTYWAQCRKCGRTFYYCDTLIPPERKKLLGDVVMYFRNCSNCEPKPIDPATGTGAFFLASLENPPYADK